ncbi:MAG: hypothetical protein INR73_03140 [Williamsia sp.]|nr:hypothetical protein [Williamsia sp.]
MPTCYIFSIGGSGTRVLESFTYLIGAGCAWNELKKWSFVPVIIDLDEKNGNTATCIQALQTYEALNASLKSTTGTSPFFRYPLSRLEGTQKDFKLQIQSPENDTLANSIQLNSLPNPDDQQLMRLLYNDNDLQMKLEKGFKGVPSIGTIVLNQFERNIAFINFKNQFQAGDRVFIIGSIFGGTGASGLPLLLKNIRAGSGALANAPIGMLSVLPYFNVKEDEKSLINSQSFITKSIAALKYYDKNLIEANTVYYIGYNSTTQYENREGGQSQKNLPHAIELMGATSIFHFLSKAEEDFVPYANYSDYLPRREFFKFGFSEKQGVLNLANLDGKTAVWIKRPLVLFYYSCLTGFFTGENFVKRNRQIRIHSISFKPGFENGDFIKQMLVFQGLFLDWLHGLDINGGDPKFLPFETKPSIDQIKEFEDEKKLPYLVKDIPISAKGLFNRLPHSIVDSFNHFDGDVSGLAGKDNHLYSEVSYLCSKTFAEEWKHI